MVFCIYFRNKIDTKGLKVFFIYTIALALLSISGLASFNFINVNSFYVYIVKLYTIVEYVLFAIMLYHFYENKAAKKLIIFSIFPFLFFSLINLYFNKNNFSSSPLLLEFFSFIVFIIYFFYEKMKSTILNPIYQNISFWICVGLFFYFSGNFFFLLFSTLRFKDGLVVQMQLVYTIVTISKNLFLSFAFFANGDIIKKNKYIQIPKDLNFDSLSPNNNIN